MGHVLITLDIDWAPERAIDFAASLLIAANVKATWFVTHESPAVDRLRKRDDLFELGIHPNFFPGSTQGDTPEAVLRHCLDLVPNAESMRTHGLFQSTRLLAAISGRSQIAVDASLFLPHAHHLTPFHHYWGRRALVRVPFFWEDDLEWERPKPVWTIETLGPHRPGWKIFNFHPIHILLNSPSTEPYERFRRHFGERRDLTQREVEPLVHRGEGSRTAFQRAIRLCQKQRRSIFVRDAARSVR